MDEIAEQLRVMATGVVVEADDRILEGIRVRARRRRARQRAMAVAGSVVLAAGIAVGVVIGSAPGQVRVSGSAGRSGDRNLPGFAVVRRRDGSVLVRITRISGLAGANRDLAARFHEQLSLSYRPGPAGGNGIVRCTPATGASLSGPPLVLSWFHEGTEVIRSAPSAHVAGTTGTGSWHVAQCVLEPVGPSGSTGVVSGAGITGSQSGATANSGTGNTGTWNTGTTGTTGTTAISGTT